MFTARTYNCDGELCGVFHGKTRRDVIRQLREEYDPGGFGDFIHWFISNIHGGTHGGVVFSKGGRRK